MHDKKRDLLLQNRIITEVYFFVVLALGISKILTLRLALRLFGKSSNNGTCYLFSMHWFSLEEERVMQHSRVSISLSF